jgi:DNA repair ATPase RecN
MMVVLQQDKSLDNHVAASMRSVEQATSASGLYFSAFSRVEEKMTLVRKATQSLQQAWDSLSQDEAKLRVLSRIQELIMSGRFNEQQLNTAANAFQDSLSPATKPIEKALPA